MTKLPAVAPRRPPPARYEPTREDLIKEAQEARQYMTSRKLLLVMRPGQARRSRQTRAALLAERASQRNQLVLDNMDLVTCNLYSIKCRVWAPQFSEEDLIGAGMLKLIVKAAEFDPSRGPTFKAFARKPVRGAMWELVRRRNWREASHLELIPEQVEIHDTRQAPEETLHSTRRHALATEAMECLEPRERQLVTRYYDGEKLGVIGESIGVGASMASLIHRTALAKIKRYFALRGRNAA